MKRFVFLLVLIVAIAHLHSVSSYSIDCKLDPDSEDCVGRHRRNAEGSADCEGSGECGSGEPDEEPDCEGSSECDEPGSGEPEPCEGSAGCDPDEDPDISGGGSGDGNQEGGNRRRKRNASPFFDDED